MLKVICRSTFDLQTVLDTLTESAASFARQTSRASGTARLRLSFGGIPWILSGHSKDYLENISIEPSAVRCVGRTLLEGRIVHIHDIQADPEYALEDFATRRLADHAGCSTPERRNAHWRDRAVRSTPRPFTAQQIELVTTFADQAVIAIENARLFDEFRRAPGTHRALEQQTATAEVLNVISRSPTSAEPVLKHRRECHAALRAEFSGYFRLYDGNRPFVVATHSFTAEVLNRFLQSHPMRPDRRDLLAARYCQEAIVHDARCTS